MTAAGILGALVAVSATPVAEADSCPVTGFLSCPGPPPSPPPPTTSTTLAPPSPPAPTPAPTTSTTSTTETTLPAQPTPEQARSHLLELVNAERVQRSIPSLTARDDVTMIATQWSDSMAQAGTLSHDDAYFSKESRSRLDAQALGENVARAGSIDQAHRALMASEHHRANILDTRFGVIGFGAVLRDGSWWVTEDFVQPRGAASGSASPVARTARGRGVERARSIGGPTSATRVEHSAGADVLAASSPPAQLLLEPMGKPGPGMSVLPGETMPSAPLRLAAFAVTLLVLVSAALLRKAARRAARLTAAQPLATEEVVELDAAELDVVDVVDVVAIAEPDGEPEDGLLHRLAVINAWVRTLDDRWLVLSDSDKRIAVQIIRRNTESVIVEMPELGRALVATSA